MSLCRVRHDACLVLLPILLGPAAASARQAPFPQSEWARSTPAGQSLDAAPLDALDARIRAGDFGLVDRMFVVRNGYQVADHRYEHDYREISRGVKGPIGCGLDACDDSTDVNEYNYYHPDFHPFYMGRPIHSLQSITKSVSSALIGIAIGRGEIAGTETPLLSLLPSYDTGGVDPRLRRATLDDLLTMRSGIEWHENDRPLNDTNTTLQLERSADWVRFTLAQPSDAEPGTKWVYNSGGSHLMSAVVRDATGMTVDLYAERYLFGPIGITEYHWKKTPAGLPDTEGGLYLEAPDLARFGYLYLRDGVWNGQRVLPDGWAAASTAIHAESVNPAGYGYGYQWWRIDRPDTPIWAGLGFGGQFLVVIPEHDLVGVINSWNLFGQPSGTILPAFISALLEAAG